MPISVTRRCESWIGATQQWCEMRNIPSSPLEKTKIARGQIARSPHARIQTPIEQVIQAVLALQGRGQTNCSAIENRRTGLRAEGAERRLQTPTEVLPKAQCWEERAEAAQCARDPCKKIQQWRAEYMLAAALTLQQVPCSKRTESGRRPQSVVFTSFIHFN